MRETAAEERPQHKSNQKTKPVTHSHYLIAHLSVFIAKTALFSIVMIVLAWAFLFWGFCTLDLRIENLLLTLKIVAAALIVLILLRRPEHVAERLRRIFGSIADIAGFWAPDLHPLAGASYRRALLSGIRQAINDLVLDFPDNPIALVGHSQGSVVCAWFVRGGHWTERRSEGRTDRRSIKELHRVTHDPSDRIALFTCGSPLESLYATFFPRYFDDEFFEKTRFMTYGSKEWHNYWRETDPIGTPLGLPDNDDVDVTEKEDDDPRGHGEYWREKKLREDISRFIESAHPHPHTGNGQAADTTASRTQVAATIDGLVPNSRAIAISCDS